MLFQPIVPAHQPASRTRAAGRPGAGRGRPETGPVSGSFSSQRGPVHQGKGNVDWSSSEQSLWTAGGCEDLRETVGDLALAAPCALEPWPGGAGAGEGAGEGLTAARKKFAKCAPRADWLADVGAILAGHHHQDDGPRPPALECFSD